MGFATFVLNGLHPFAAIGWKFAKLLNKLKSTRGSLPALEKMAVFALDLTKPDLALAYFVGRAVIDKVLATRWANSTEKYLDIVSEGQELTLEQVNTAFDVTKHNRAPKELYYKAGFLYLSECLKKHKAGDPQVHTRYSHGSRFDHIAALCDFYGTEASDKLADALGQYDQKTLTVAVRGTVLLPLVEAAWQEVQEKMRRDLVDLLLT